MVKASTVRAEIARQKLRKWKLAQALGIPADVVSQVLNEKRERPDILAKIWEHVKAATE